MADEKLLKYIKDGISKGWTNEQITQVLLRAGYQEQDIEQAYNSLNQTPQKQGASALAILALVFSLIFFPVGLILSIIALIQANKTKNQTDKILAIIALIISIIAILLIILLFGSILSLFYIQSTQKQLQEGIEQSQEDFIRNLNVEIRVLQATYNPQTDNLTTIIINYGGEPFTIEPATTKATIRSLDAKISCTVPTSTTRQSLYNATIRPATGVQLSFLLHKCKIDKTPQKQYTFIIGLSGKTTASGSFKIPE